MEQDSSYAAAIVAHPDDEVLWAGGTILLRPDLNWHVASVCRGTDTDRAPKFSRVVERLGATGAMADLDDGPDQIPLDPVQVCDTVVSLLPPGRRFALVLTHGPCGEYTRHRRHEEVCRAVVKLWKVGRIETDELRMFAYEDCGRAYLPRPRDDAHMQKNLTDEVFQRKYALIAEEYGFSPDSWEARSTPRVEAFYCFDSPERAAEWVRANEVAT